MMKPIKISNFEDFVSRITKTFVKEDLSENYLLYRGQKDATWDLLPKIARHELPPNFLEKEKQNLDEFKRLGRSYISNDILSNSWDLIALAQHYGLGTRLLDWSSNPLVALWFAFENEEKQTTDRAVWLLILEKNEIADTFTGTPFNQTKTKAFKPNHITNRITAQNGWFTTHKFIKADSKFIKLNNNKSYTDKIIKFEIANKERENILKSLDMLGINYYSLFSDLDGLAKYLNWEKD